MQAVFSLPKTLRKIFFYSQKTVKNEQSLCLSGYPNCVTDIEEGNARRYSSHHSKTFFSVQTKFLIEKWLKLCFTTSKE